MPGTKWKRSLKRPDIYEALMRKRGMTKERAARISNSMASKGKGGRRKR